MAFSELLSLGLSKLKPIRPGTIVYRIMRLNESTINEYAKKAENGEPVTFKGFTSTTLRMSVINDFWNMMGPMKEGERSALLVIKGGTERQLGGLSRFSGRFDGYPNQSEVLFDKGMNCVIEELRIDNDTYVIYMTEIY